MSNTTVTPKANTRLSRVLKTLVSNSRRNRWTGSVAGLDRDQFLDDISRLRTRGWNVVSKKTRDGLVYRVNS